METQIISAIIDRELYSKVRQHCVKQGKKIKYFLAEALQDKLIKDKKCKEK